jgi:cell wall-associated NlpC family hydrolase/acid phosphatase family membrane protein YuiD
VSKSVERTEKKFGFLAARTGGLTAGMTAGFGKIAGAMVAVASVQVFKGFIDEARESRKVAALTESIIKSTGGAAKVSAKQVSDLATSISNKTGVDDEAIQSGSNLLLTFKNVRNEVGKGAKIFDRATAAAVDLSAAGFGDVNSASKMLGKALNDPLKGISALGKAGVTFTEDQKKQIKTLVETGKTLEAQKIILQEVESQVGGAAAASADPMQKLGVIIGNVKEAIGTAFLPVVDKVAGLLGRVLPVAVEKAKTGFSALGAAFREGDVTSGGFVGVMERIGVAARAVFGFFKAEVLPRLREFGSFIVNTAAPAVATFAANLASTLGPAIKDVFGFFTTTVLPRLQDFGSFLGEKVLPKIGALASSLSKNKDFLVPFAATIGAVVVAMKTWAVVQGVLNVVMAANPIGLVVVAIAALVGGLVYAYKHSEKFREIVDRMGVAAGLTFVSIGRAVLGLVKIMMPALKFMTMGFLDFVGGILHAAAQVDNALGGKLGLQKASDSFNKFKEVAGKAFDGAVAKAGEWDKSLAATQKTLVLKANIQDLESKLKTAKAGLTDKNLTKERRAHLVATIKDLETKIRTAKGQLSQPALVATKIAKLQANKRDLDAKLSAAKRQLQDPNLTKERRAQINANIAKLTAALRTAQTQINNLKGKVVEIKYTSNGVNLTTPSRVGGKAAGGKIYGPGSDTSDRAGVFALSNNEWVIKAKSSQKYGDHAMQSVNNGTAQILPGMATGGKATVGIHTRNLFDSAAQGNRILTQMLGGPALAWAKSQAGKPYLWGGVGPGGYDCSGFMSAIVNVIRGQNPHSRLFATGSLPGGLFAKGSGRFNIGWFKGNPGHTAGTLNGVNVESRGGRGVVVGAGARGASDGLFNSGVWHLKGYARGGKVRAGDPPYDGFGKWLETMRSYAGGTPYVPHDGPAYLHRGERVTPASQNRPQTVVLRVESGGSRMDDFLAEMIRRYVRVNGGDVQKVLGRG